MTCSSHCLRVGTSLSMMCLSILVKCEHRACDQFEGMCRFPFFFVNWEIVFRVRTTSGCRESVTELEQSVLFLFIRRFLNFRMLDSEDFDYIHGPYQAVSGVQVIIFHVRIKLNPCIIDVAAQNSFLGGRLLPGGQLM